ncbi:MAG: DUF3035 domain-containing protein [Pseudomonadaceae bacterium]|nr:DUF3035 domain-containing protein [Pseudomonadaceae bacterium]
MRVILPLVAVAVFVAACGETKLLSSRTPPDETRVIDGPTLAVPPDFNLRPPSDAADYEAVLRAQKTAEARALITGGAAPVSATAAGDNTWLLNEAGSADADIRSKLEIDAVAQPEEEKTFWQKLLRKEGSK